METHSDDCSSSLFESYRSRRPAKVLIEILQAMGTVDITGLLNVDPKLWKSKQLGIVVPGSDELVPKLFEDGIRQVFIGVGSTGESNLGRHLFAKAQHLRFVVMPCIHPRAVISPSATFGEGPNVVTGAVVDSAGVPARPLRKVKA